MRQLKKQKKLDFDREIVELEASDKIAQERIKTSQLERDSLLGFKEEGTDHTIDEYTMGMIKTWTNKLYHLASTG